MSPFFSLETYWIFLNSINKFLNCMPNMHVSYKINYHLRLQTKNFTIFIGKSILKEYNIYTSLHFLRTLNKNQVKFMIFMNENVFLVFASCPANLFC